MQLEIPGGFHGSYFIFGFWQFTLAVIKLHKHASMLGVAPVVVRGAPVVH